MKDNLYNLAFNSFDDFCNFLIFIDEDYIRDEESLIELQKYARDKFSYELNDVLTLTENKLNKLLSNENIYQEIVNNIELNYAFILDNIEAHLPADIEFERNRCLEIIGTGVRNLYNYVSSSKLHFLSIEDFFLEVDDFLKFDFFESIINDIYLFYDLVKKSEIDDFDFYLRYLSLIPSHAYRYYLDPKASLKKYFKLNDVILYYKAFTDDYTYRYKAVVMDKLETILSAYQAVYFNNFNRLIKAYHETFDEFDLAKLNDYNSEQLNKIILKFIDDSEKLNLAYEELDFIEPYNLTGLPIDLILSLSDKEKYYYGKLYQLKSLINVYKDTNIFEYAKAYIFVSEPNVVNLEMFKDLCLCLRDDRFYNCSAIDTLWDVCAKVLESKLNNSLIISRNNYINHLIHNYESNILIYDFFIYLANYMIKLNNSEALEEIKYKNNQNYRSRLVKKFNRKIKKHTIIYNNIMDNSNNCEEIINLATNLMISKPLNIRKYLSRIGLSGKKEFESNLKLDISSRYEYLKNDLYANISNESYIQAINSLLIFFGNESDIGIVSASIFDIYLNELYKSFSLN